MGARLKFFALVLAGAAASAIAATAGRAGAQGPGCQSIGDEAQRLACYDKLAECKVISGSGVAEKGRLACYELLDVAHAPSPTQAAASGTPATAGSTWSFEDSRSPVDDSAQVGAMDKAADGASRNAALFLRCREHHSDLYVMGDGYWGGEDTLMVLYRINDAPAVANFWRAAHGAAGVSAAFFPDRVQDFVSALPATGKIFIRVTDFEGQYHDATFALDGVDEARRRVAAACKWPASNETKTTAK